MTRIAQNEYRHEDLADVRFVPHLIRMWLESPVEETDERGRKTRTTGARVAEILGEFEACGEAMRFLNRSGEIVWRATPRMRRDSLTLNARPKPVWKTGRDAWGDLVEFRFQLRFFQWAKKCNRLICRWTPELEIQRSKSPILTQP